MVLELCLYQGSDPYSAPKKRKLAGQRRSKISLASDSGAVSVSTARKPMCKPDAPEWDETEETEQNERTVLVPVRRGHRIRERSSKRGRRTSHCS